jgi:spore germination protein
VYAPSDQRRTQVRTRRVVGLITALLISACGPGSSSNHPIAPATNRPVIAGYVSPWNSRALPSIDLARRRGRLTEVSPVLYTADTTGTVLSTTAPGPLLSKARALHLAIIPAIQNYHRGFWDGALIAAIVHDRSRRSRHVHQVVSLVLRNGWNGIDVDYENLRPADAANYLELLRQLSAELHRAGKLLTVAVPAKTSDRGDDPTAQAYDYRAVGKVADEVRVMAYDHAWETSAPGPIAPVTWVAQVLDYARHTVAPAKLMLGIAAYGYDWVGHRGVPLSADAATGLAARYHADMRWDTSSESEWFRYTAAGREHTVWFENAAAMIQKTRLARSAGIRGIVVWELGVEDPTFWTSQH